MAVGHNLRSWSLSITYRVGGANAILEVWLKENRNPRFLFSVRGPPAPLRSLLSLVMHTNGDTPDQPSIDHLTLTPEEDAHVQF